MRVILLAIPCAVLVAAFAFCSGHPASAEPPEQPVILVLVDELTWKEVRDGPRLRGLFENGASANVSTAQGARPEDPRMGYVFLGAGARVDTLALPEDLPREPARLANAFTGPASTVKPGAFGEALAENGIKAAAIGESARLVVMDREGEVPLSYGDESPVSRLEETLERGAGFVAVEAATSEEAGDLVEASSEARATVAVASANSPAGSTNLTPFALSGEEGLLYSPATRTAGLISNADVAPTLLAELGVEVPAGMQGRDATVRPGTYEQAERLGERISFVAENRYEVWVMVLIFAAAVFLFVGFRSGWSGARPVILTLAALPAGALLVGAVPVTNAPAVAAMIVACACILTLPAWRLAGGVFGALAFVCLATATLVSADAAAGGALMKFSTLGYNPFSGSRFYGIGNEYAAILAGSLTMGLGALAESIRERGSRRGKLPAVPLALVGAAVVIVVALPTMGADVGGSVALGVGFGATAALVRGGYLRSVALWVAGGLAFAAALFLASGVLFPGVSHGSRAAGGESDLSNILVSKLLFGLSVLFDPYLIVAFFVLAFLTYAGWRRVRGTPLAAGILGASITALVSGAINDSALIATLFALLYPALASAVILLDPPASRKPRVA